MWLCFFYIINAFLNICCQIGKYVFYIGLCSVSLHVFSLAAENSALRATTVKHMWEITTLMSMADVL